MSLLLPDGALMLHIGPQKTGSTAIQMAMHESRADLAGHGVLYPGSGMRPREAGWAVLGVGAAVGRKPPRIAAWDNLVAEINGSALPRICVSNEDFARADAEAVERIVTPLGPDRIHLVFVARRLDRLLPSHWQERVKARMTLSYADFLRHVLDDPSGDWESRVMWEPHDVSTVLERWAKYIDRDRITVIVSDESDQRMIPRTFEEMLGLPDGQLLPPATRSNTSMTYVETEAVRRLNLMAREDGWTPRQYWRVIQAGAVGALKHRAGGGERITGLPDWAFERVADRADAQIAAINDAGVRVLGDPSLLDVRRKTEPADLPGDVESVSLDLLADLVRGAVDGAASLHARELRAELRRQRSRTADLGGRQLARLLARQVAYRIGVRRSPGR